MNSNHNPALVGRWRNYRPDGTTELLVSVRDPWGVIVIALAGIWLSWSTKYIKKIVGNGAIWLQLQRQPDSRGEDDGANQRGSESASRNGEDDATQIEEPASEDTHLLGRGTRSRHPKNRDAKLLALTLKEKSGIRDLLAEVFLGEHSLTAAARMRLFMFTIIILFLASGVIIGGYFVAKIKVDGPARLASNTCGLWLFEGEKRSEAATRARMLDLEKEERAAYFAENCYRQSSSIGSRCKLLYRPTLTVSPPMYTNDCPFAPDICRFNQTVTFKTPLIDAKELGINSALTPKIRRTTACTPLSMEYPYIQNTTQNGTTTYTYHYGTKNEVDGKVNYTYRTVGNPWEKLAPIYDVFAYSWSSNTSDDAWVPDRHLADTVPRYSSITIIFISSLRILYEERSDDPLFPADKEYFLPGDPKPWFRNSDPRARPLACIDTIEVCSLDGKVCWNYNLPEKDTPEEYKPDVANRPEYALLYASLYKTDTYYSLAKRQGRALMAQKRVSQYFSAKLGSDPWVTEVESLVWTALARTSINVWSVASGEDSIHEGKDGFIRETPDNLCGLYKYNPQGYQSLRFIPIILVATWLPFIWILSWDAKRVEWIYKKPSHKIKEIWNARVSALKVQRARSRQDRHIQEEQQQVAGPSVATVTNTGDQNEPTSENDEDKIEWEPLLVWQIIYCICFLVYYLGKILVVIISLPFSFLASQLSSPIDDTSMHSAATTASSSS